MRNSCYLLNYLLCMFYPPLRFEHFKVFCSYAEWLLNGCENNHSNCSSSKHIEAVFYEDVKRDITPWVQLYLNVILLKEMLGEMEWLMTSWLKVEGDDLYSLVQFSSLSDHADSLKWITFVVFVSHVIERVCRRERTAICICKETVASQGKRAPSYS